MFEFLKKLFANKPDTIYVDLDALRKRNEERMERAKEEMGEKYLLHPNNQVKRLSKRQQKRFTTFYGRPA